LLAAGGPSVGRTIPKQVNLIVTELHLSLLPTRGGYVGGKRGTISSKISGGE